jgi:hypothetical protein
MPRRSTKKERGVFEKDPGSEIWWIRYYIDGRERREKVGRKKDASDLYKIRKANALRGVNGMCVPTGKLLQLVCSREPLSGNLEEVVVFA